jgi:hypothetical protein
MRNTGELSSKRARHQTEMPRTHALLLKHGAAMLQPQQAGSFVEKISEE